MPGLSMRSRTCAQVACTYMRVHTCAWARFAQVRMGTIDSRVCVCVCVCVWGTPGLAVVGEVRREAVGEVEGLRMVQAQP